MLTIPGIRLREASRATTSILCPKDCGETVLRLGPREAVATASSSGAFLTNQREEEGTCPKCGATFRLAVGER
jgi:predicted RNA-binding Zn-ribbon protein involved in translation (DUF1610 family)